MNSFYKIITLLLVSGSLWAQLPTANIYYFEFRDVSDSLRVTDFKWLTNFNPDGYNNQPSFIGDRELYISSDWQSDQPDIIKLNLNTRRLTRVTQTTAGEYSPKLLSDKRSFSAVKQDAEENQYLWSYPSDQIGLGSNIFKNLNKFGYYHWLNSKQVVAFYLGAPHELILLDLNRPGEVKIIDSDIGRTITSKYGKLYYVKKASTTNWYIMEYNVATGSAKKLVNLPKDVEDFAIAADGRFYCGKGSQMYRYSKPSTEWTAIGDLASFGVNNITRIVIRKNKMCLVDAQ